ncbi:MAG: diacylglycerol/lipid kinase family protein [Planctomycetota bacterium]|jgi:diacylglycerol kinase family enzyme
MRFHIVENPSAGRSRTDAYRETVAAALSAGEHEVTSYVGGAPGDLERHVRALDRSEVDRLLVLGGDGTLRAILNARAGGIPWPVGVIPVGTANLAARETGIPLGTDPEVVARALLAAEPWRVDVLELRGPEGRIERALTTVGVGLDAEIVDAVHRTRRGAHAKGGYLRWLRPMAKVFQRYRYVPIEVVVDDGLVQHGAEVVVQNARSFGGLWTLSPDAALDSGRLDVVVMRVHAARDVVRIGLRALAGRLRRDRRCRVTRGRRVLLRAASPVPAQADGDPAGTTDLEVRVLPGALTLLRYRGRELPPT